jgi:hypothetical protein
MKPITGYKSLLLGSGLLLISLIGLRLSQTDRTDIPHARKAEKNVPATKCVIDPTGASYIKDIAEKLFPVLKSLNLM